MALVMYTARGMGRLGSVLQRGDALLFQVEVRPTGGNVEHLVERVGNR